MIEKIQKAIQLTQMEKFDEAEVLYKELYKENSHNPILLSALGLFYVSKRDYKNAILYLQKAYDINPNKGVSIAYGLAAYECKNYKQAIDVLLVALSFGDNLDVYDKLVLSLFHIRDYKNAVSYAEKMYELYKDNPKSVSNIVKAYTYNGKLIDAERICVEYLREHPETPSLWFHLGYLKELIYKNDKEAMECYKVVLNLGNPEAYYNIGVSYQKQGLFKEAEDAYFEMLKHFPNDNMTLTSLGMLYLRQKKFKKGYEYFFKRERKPIEQNIKKLWEYGDKFDNTVQVISDQGFGDFIQFSRYLPILKEKCKNLLVHINEPLKSLFEQNYSDIDFISKEEIKPDIQSIRITDLAYALDLDFDNIPYSNGYLKSDKLILESSKPKIGLCWEAGNAGIRTMINRTIHVKSFEPIINLDNIQTYSFQVDDSFDGVQTYPQIIDLAKNFKNFSDTAKAIMAMDIVITVDTAIAHLSGALEKKTYLLLPTCADWRWFEDKTSTPWYDSIEIFKQTNPLNWEEPIGEILCKIKEFYS